jgi:excisionase family DNA binding protein
VTTPPAQPRYASTVQVAEALGVSVTTVKRWVDDHILPAHRTAGGHRKVLLADVLRLARDGKLPHADLSRLHDSARSSPLETVRSEFGAAMESTDADAIRDVLLAAYRGGTKVETLADEVIAPAMTRVGRDWETGQLSVMREHEMSQACVAALYDFAKGLNTKTDARQPVAVGGAPEHDHYVLPSLLTKLALADSGWDAVNLGPHTPAEAFRTAIRDLKPKLIWVSVSHLPDPHGFLPGHREVYRMAEEHGVAVAVGGRGLTGDIRGKMPYTMFGDGLTQLVAFARTLNPWPTQPRRGRPPKK